MSTRALFAAWVRQQKELGMPDFVFSGGFDPSGSLTKDTPPAAMTVNSAPPQALKMPAIAIPAAPLKKSDPFAKLSRLAPITTGPLSPAIKKKSGKPLSYDQKRAVFTEMYRAGCTACSLSQTRKSFVFGAGNVSAPLMIIGEAPGAEEDAQNRPFVGPAGKLLTTLLSRAGINREKETFITNVLKCRPPENRNPETGEVLACIRLLEKQILVISPKIILLLGKSAAHALLSRPDSVAKMRGRMLSYNDIPVMVTYHPAALLRSDEYRPPAEEDFQTVARFLKENAPHGASQ
ncbi:MAG: uracil-DNA glycosylase [Chitinispirillaceae bacterium]|jgi:DNA polymerase|nr:uracil-DNA glycosylase [Chitinispirillaceae bacterium]